MGGVSRHCELFTAGELECSARWSGPFWPGRPSWKASAMRRLRLEGGEQQLLRCVSVDFHQVTKKPENRSLTVAAPKSGLGNYRLIPRHDRKRAVQKMELFHSQQ